MSRTTLEQIKQMSRAGLSSVAASVGDYGLVILLVEVFGVWYLGAVIAGAVLGALCCFLLSTRWVFSGVRALGGDCGPGRLPILRFVLIYATGVLLFVGLVYLLADGVGLHYLLSKILAGTTVFMSWNYPLQRHFVFLAAAPLADRSSQPPLTLAPTV